MKDGVRKAKDFSPMSYRVKSPEEQLSAIEDRVRRLFVRWVDDPWEREDLIQEAYVKILDLAHKFEGRNKSQFFTWAYPIVRGMYADHLEKKQKTSKLQSFEDLPETHLGGDTFDDWVRGYMTSTLNNLFRSKLTSTERLLVACHVFEKMTFEEIVVGFPRYGSAEAARSLFRRIMARLKRECMAKGIGFDEVA